MSTTNNVNVFQGDIRKIPFKDKYFLVTHSSGVMEHYRDDEIVEIINEQYQKVWQNCCFLNMNL